MKLLFDMFPVLIFYVVYKLYDFYAATAAIIVVTILQVTINWFLYRKIEKMLLMMLAIIIVLGGLTLLLREELFVKWKPTIVNWGMALVFLGSHFIGKKPLIRRILDSKIGLPDNIWQRLSYAWVIFFAFSGTLNLYFVYHTDTDTWVNFKLFGLLGLSLLFFIAQVLFLAKHVKHDPAANDNNFPKQ